MVQGRGATLGAGCCHLPPYTFCRDSGFALAGGFADAAASGKDFWVLPQTQPLGGDPAAPGVQHHWGSSEPLPRLLLRGGRAAEPQWQGRAVCQASREPWPMGQWTWQSEDTQITAFWLGTCGPSLGPALGLSLQLFWSGEEEAQGRPYHSLQLPERRL